MIAKRKEKFRPQYDLWECVSVFQIYKISFCGIVWFSLCACVVFAEVVCTAIICLRIDFSCSMLKSWNITVRTSWKLDAIKKALFISFGHIFTHLPIFPFPKRYWRDDFNLKNSCTLKVCTFCFILIVHDGFVNFNEFLHD